jgi:DNA-directed RNA polymerase II subunit RPB1
MADLAERIHADFEGELHCIFNDDNAPKLVLRIRILTGDDDGGGDDKADYDDAFLKKIEGTLLTQVALQGVPSIKKVFIRETDRLVPDAAAAGGYASEKEWMLDTEGVNLLEVLAHPDVDATRTISNHLVEVIDVLGIEAARGALLKEVRGVIEFDGSYVNYRHLAILCDAMTSRGHFAAITRHGINRGDAAGALAQASFEETVEILYRAAAFAESDPVTGVSEAVMLGQLAPIGTGAFSLLLDEARLADAVEVQVAGGLGGGYDGGGGGGFGAMPTPGRATPGMTPSHASPSVFRSPGMWSPLVGDGAVQFSPAVGGGASPAFSPAHGGGGASPSYAASPAYVSPASPAYAASPAYVSPASPAWASPTSPAYAAGPSPTSPAYSPGAASPAYAPTAPSPAYSPGGASPAYSPSAASPAYSPSAASPAYSPSAAAPAYSPSGASPAYSPSAASPAYSPSAAAPAYSPGGVSPAYSPGGGVSPAYAPTAPSPAYSPGGGAPPPPGQGGAAQFSPSSPVYQPEDQQ